MDIGTLPFGAFSQRSDMDLASCSISEFVGKSESKYYTKPLLMSIFTVLSSWEREFVGKGESGYYIKPQLISIFTE
jgi:hypothetical protein